MGLFFQSAVLCTARHARAHALGRAVVQFLDLLAQFPQTQRLVLMLAAFLLRSNYDAGWQVSETNGALGFVDVLAARAARSKRVDLALAQQVFVGCRQ